MRVINRETLVTVVAEGVLSIAGGRARGPMNGGPIVTQRISKGEMKHTRDEVPPSWKAPGLKNMGNGDNDATC